jgi:tetratricopeptide (TPR) repeat protein
MDRGVEHLRRATELNPEDERAWAGLGEALERAGELEEADEAYQRTIELAGFGDVAEVARRGRSRIAQASMRSAVGGSLRMDAVMYCVAALEKFEAMPEADLKTVGLEIATMGRQGIDVNNPGQRYRLKSLEGEFTGMQLMSYFYVAMKKIAPEQDIGFDLTKEYEAAERLHSGNTEG